MDGSVYREGTGIGLRGITGVARSNINIDRGPIVGPGVGGGLGRGARNSNLVAVTVQELHRLFRRSRLGLFLIGKLIAQLFQARDLSEVVLDLLSDLGGVRCEEISLCLFGILSEGIDVIFFDLLETLAEVVLRCVEYTVFLPQFFFQPSLVK